MTRDGESDADADVKELCHDRVHGRSRRSREFSRAMAK